MEKQTEHREHPADTSIETPDHGAIQAIKNFVGNHANIVLYLTIAIPLVTFYGIYGPIVANHYEVHQNDPNYKPLPLERFVLSPLHKERLTTNNSNQLDQE